MLALTLTTAHLTAIGAGILGLGSGVLLSRGGRKLTSALTRIALELHTMNKIGIGMMGRRSSDYYDENDEPIE